MNNQSLIQWQSVGSFVLTWRLFFSYSLKVLQFPAFLQFITFHFYRFSNELIEIDSEISITNFFALEKRNFAIKTGQHFWSRDEAGKQETSHSKPIQTHVNNGCVIQPFSLSPSGGFSSCLYIYIVLYSIEIYLYVVYKKILYEIENVWSSKLSHILFLPNVNNIYFRKKIIPKTPDNFRKKELY